ncbi:Calx-beta domain-containing protein [Sphingobium yanoikuyae]|uniref:Calx-beta domain-containing protein n=1 Tax=Sphingobium yanoikuyae TaxID=13690 RepID=UPI0024319698|nr:Calx-beta domain-containing protein [Sphingobium yanoikuyae]
MTGSSYASYVVRLSRAATESIFLQWATIAGTAVPGTDYEETSGGLTFAPGETEKTIQVLVYGRTGNDTTPRTFSIKLTPTPGVILGAEMAKCIIRVVDESGATIAAVTMAAGPAGDDGKDAFAVAQAAGFTGTLAEWLASLKGEPGDKGDDGGDGADAYAVAVLTGFTGTRAEWLASLKGEPGDKGEDGDKGDDGRSVEFQRGATYLQWRLVGDTAWTNLVALADIKGEAGTGLSNRGDWAAGTYHAGDYVFAPGSTAATSMWILRGDADYVSASAPAGDVEHWIEFEAPAGPPGDAGSNGRQVEFQKSSTAIQWRYVGDTAWTDLVLLTAIKGDPGNAGAAGSKWYAAAGVPAAATGANGDYYLNVTTGDVYGPKASGAWGTAVGNIKGAAGSGGATLATSDQAKAADLATIAATPAGVREYLEQFGLTATYTTAPADLDSIVKGGFFNWGNTTTHAPIANSYGRGICIPSGDKYVTQLSIENGTGLMHARFQDNGTWGAWVAVSGASGSGTKWYSGAGAPAAATGANGDYYLNLTNGDVYGPKASGAWGSAVGNLKGPAGSGGSGSSAVTALRSTDLGVTEITLVDALSFAVEVNTIYNIRVNLLYRTTDVSKGIRVGFGGTAGVQSLAVRVNGFDSAGAPVGKFCKAKATPVIFNTSPVGGDDNVITVEGVLYATATGTFTVQIGAAVLYDYTAAQKGSHGILTPVGTIAA